MKYIPPQSIGSEAKTSAVTFWCGSSKTVKHFNCRARNKYMDTKLIEDAQEKKISNLKQVLVSP
jgi:hypothetical protein